MEFTDTFTVPKPIDEVWGTITSLDKVVPLVPDASVVDGGGSRVTAQIKIRLGSMSMEYTGPAELVEQNDGAHTAVMTAQAKEKGGQGTADARVQVSLSPAGDGTEGQLKSTVNVSGKAAQMGEGMIGPVTQELIKGFAANLAKL
ncbi:MAG TPA: SRPBCC family protein [Solirubrobacteraceae bacterium]|nr:SRPBCC family protein [Solirubrobacteraceae bacterium]